MKQVYIVLSDEYQKRPVLSFANLEDAEAAAAHLYGNAEKGHCFVRRIPFIHDEQNLTLDYYEFELKPTGERI